MGGAENNALISLFILLLTISHVSLLLNSVIAVNPSGFSLKIMHRDSKESPLYPGDHLTQEERLERLVQQSKDRARYIGLQISSFNKTTNSINPDVSHLPLRYEAAGSYYVARLGLGTFTNSPFINYYLIVDSGSELIWTQCKGAVSSFYQDQPHYPYLDSSTYEPLRCQDGQHLYHPLCYPGQCSAGKCTYESWYLSKASSSGELATEKITVDSGSDGLQSFNIIMGCGFRQRGFDQFVGSGHRSRNPDIITGILGLGWGPRSLVNQLGPAGGGKFSYCLKSYTYGTSSDTYLSFGSDATIGGGGQQVYTTPLFYHPNGPGAYYLNLEDISVNGIRLGFQRRDFEYDPNARTGGTFIDTGSPVTVMHRTHFKRVSERVCAYFYEKFSMLPVPVSSRSKFSICYKKPSMVLTYPTVTFHFENADFVLDNPDTMFSIADSWFCLGLLQSNDAFSVIFGAMQQARKNILYDTTGMSLSFAAQEC